MVGIGFLRLRASAGPKPSAYVMKASTQRVPGGLNQPAGYFLGAGQGHQIGRLRPVEHALWRANPAFALHGGVETVRHAGPAQALHRRNTHIAIVASPHAAPAAPLSALSRRRAWVWVWAGALPVRISASQVWRCFGASTTRYFLFMRIFYWGRALRHATGYPLWSINQICVDGLVVPNPQPRSKTCLWPQRRCQRRVWSAPPAQHCESGGGESGAALCRLRTSARAECARVLAELGGPTRRARDNS